MCNAIFNTDTNVLNSLLYNDYTIFKCKCSQFNDNDLFSYTVTQKYSMTMTMTVHFLFNDTRWTLIFLRNSIQYNTYEANVPRMSMQFNDD